MRCGGAPNNRRKNMEARDLAKMTLRVLDLQAEYFRTRATEKLSECKTAERELRKVCAETINPPQKVPTLFETIMTNDSDPTEAQRKLMQEESARAMRDQEREDAKKAGMAARFGHVKPA